MILSGAALVWQAQVVKGGTAYVLARLRKKDSSNNLVIVAQSDFTSISRKVLLKSDSSVILGPDVITVSAAILNSLSLGTLWTRDKIGFNFIDAVPPTAFPTKDVTDRVEYKFTLTGGEVFWLPIDCFAVGTLT